MNRRVTATVGAAIILVACQAAPATSPASTLSPQASVAPSPTHGATRPPGSPTVVPPTSPVETLGPPSPTPAATRPTPVPALVPVPTTLDAARATFLKLGSGSTPIDLIYAFDSIWVANHHSNDVSRIDPGTVTQIARIPAGSGPGWFAATDDAIWVSNQNGVGVTRIDPATNQAVASIGNLPPCGPLGVAAGFVWQSACFSGRYVKIDPATNNAEELDSEGHGDFVAVGDVLYTGVGPGVALFDARTGEFTEIGGCCGLPIGFDGTAVWLSDETATVSRVDVATGEVVATLSLPAARAVAVRDGRAWVTAGREGVVEVDLESNERLRALEILPSPVVVRDAGGALWVTEQANHAVWRVEP